MSSFFRYFIKGYIAYVYDVDFMGYILHVLNIVKRGIGGYCVTFDSYAAWRWGRVVCCIITLP